MTFNPNDAAAKDSGIFGLPFDEKDAQLLLLPVPWEATTSYGGGTANGPDAILTASKQVDLFDLELGNFYEAGIAMLQESAELREWNTNAKLAEAAEKVNSYSQQVNDYVYQQTKKCLASGKKFGLVGGDHSSPFGAIQAFLEYHPNMSILHVDAHADMRTAYEGFEHSHASIMQNVITKTPLKKLVQIGIRDFCEDELQFMRDHQSRVVTFFDAKIVDEKMNGKTFSALCDEIVEHLTDEVYVSFDIDGLDPRFCPNTGTPVPGGLDFNEALYLLKKIVQSGRKIIGFDLCEVSLGETDIQSEWDANVGARLLYKLCGHTITSTSS
jgi:agmatinase